jgi:hypothetical protein
VAYTKLTTCDVNMLGDHKSRNAETVKNSPEDADQIVSPLNLLRELELQNGGPQNRWSGDTCGLGVHLYRAVWQAASFPVGNLPT